MSTLGSTSVQTRSGQTYNPAPTPDSQTVVEDLDDFFFARQSKGANAHITKNRFQATLPHNNQSTDTYRVQTRPYTHAYQTVLCAKAIAAATIKARAQSSTRTKITVKISTRTLHFYVNIPKNTRLTPGNDPVACTCPDWFFRGASGYAQPIGTRGQHSVNFSQFHTKNLKPKGCTMGAIKGCKHMLAVSEDIQASSP